MAQQGFPRLHLEATCWAISVERLYLHLPTCPASHSSSKKRTEWYTYTLGKLPVRSIALLEVPVSIFPIYQSETSHILFCYYELLCYRYRAMQFYILALQGRISTRTSGPVDAQRLPRLRRFLRKLSAISCRILDRICTRLYLTQITRRSANGYRAMQFRILAQQGSVNTCAPARWTHNVFRAYGVSYASFLLSAAGYLIEYAHVYTLHKLSGVQPTVTVQCSFAFWPSRVV